MKIKATKTYEEDRDETVAEYTEYHLDGSECNSGQIETINRSCNNNRRAFGVLLELLATKGLITAPEITEIVEGDTNDNAKFWANSVIR